MIDPRTEELVHEELDGRLDEAGRAELGRRLAADADARALRDDLAKMDQAWGRLAPLPMPAGLESRLRVVISRDAAQRRPSRSNRVLRPLVALAAGLLLAALGLSWFAPIFMDGLPQGFEGQVGATLALPGKADPGRDGPAEALDGTAAGIALRPAADGWRLVIDPGHGQPARVRLAYDATALRLQGYPADAEVSEAAGEGRAVIASPDGRLELRLVPRGPMARSRIRVRLEPEGGQAREVLLETGPARR